MVLDINELVTIVYQNNLEVYGKIVKKTEKDYIIALGRLGKFNFKIKDKNKKISWGNHFEFPSHDYGLMKNDILVKYSHSSKTDDFKICKRTNGIHVNDVIVVKLIGDTTKSFNVDMPLIKTIPNIKEGVKCKILNINMWEPSAVFEHHDKVYKIIPGSLSLATGKYITKKKEPLADTSPIYNRQNINNQPANEIKEGNCIFDLHLRDIDYIFSIYDALTQTSY